jgi:hypothetical protein
VVRRQRADCFHVQYGFARRRFFAPEWNKIKDAKPGKVFTREVVDNWLPDAPTRVIEYVAPFDRCDREEDYRTAWAFFDEHGDS